MSNADKSKIAKMLGDVQKTSEWETVRARNAWVNIYNPEGKFVSFLEKQTTEMTAVISVVCFSKKETNLPSGL